MNVLSIISLTCFIIVMLIGLLFAGMYLFRKKFMPYHADAVGKSWNELDREIRVLIIALMRVAQALSIFEGRDFLIPETIKQIAGDVIAHRLVLSHEAKFSGATGRSIVEQLLDTIPVPV